MPQNQQAFLNNALLGAVKEPSLDLQTRSFLITAFLQSGAEVNARDQEGRTSLMLAVLDQDLATVRFLLAMHGTSVSVRDHNGQTALMHASYKGCFEIVRALVSAECGEEQFKVRDTAGRTALMYAEQCGHSEIAEFLKRRHFRVAQDTSDGCCDQTGKPTYALR